MGSIKAQYECIRVLSETEFYNDLDVIDVPVLVMHGMPTTHAETINADLLAFYQGVTRPGATRGSRETHLVTPFSRFPSHLRPDRTGCLLPSQWKFRLFALMTSMCKSGI